MDKEARCLDQIIDQATNETLNATRRILHTAEETNKIGVDTLVILNEQGEKLDNIEENMDRMNVDLKRADKNLRELESVCGCCHCPTPNIQGTKKYKETFGSNAKNTGVIVSQPIGGCGHQGSNTPEGGYINRITRDEREDEMEQNLQAVDGILDNLHAIAIDMGSELSRQNNQLRRINQKAEVNEAHIAVTNYRTKQQLN